MKKPYLILGLFLLSLAYFPISLRAQIIITPSVTAATLMNKLLGNGVIAFNPTMTCPVVANGTFSVTTSTPLMFDSGIVLTTGTAAAASSPAATGSHTNNGGPGDPMLTTLSGSTTFNACILEFDFRPAGDTVKFDYVFGSEEYNGFTCSGFNDPFGFFISGPGFAPSTNIALVPGTSIPVCINSINCGGGLGGPLSTCTALGPGSPFCTYYINNIGGSLIVYDGITTKLTAIAAVTPCDTYHLKLGVADCLDGIYDSGVFLKAGSLTSTSISIAPIGMNPGDTVAGSEFCVRGCLPAKFVFRRQGNLTNPLTIRYLIGGTAVNGVDYSTIADSVIIGASDSDEVVLIHGLPVIPTGPKIVKIFILAPYTCGGSAVVIDSAEITIIDSFFVKINTSDTAICQGQYVSISASGDTSLNFTWSPAGSLSSTSIVSPIATPTVTTTYTLTGIYPAVGCLPSKDVITITVYERPTINAGSPIQITCQGVPLQLNVSAFPSGIPYTYSWTPSTYLSSGSIANPIFTPGDSVDRVQTVTVSAPVPGCSTDTSFFLHVLPNDFTLYNLDTGICFPPSSYQIRILGDTEFTYNWTPEIGVSDVNIKEPIVSPPSTMIYTVTASYPKCPDMKHTVLYSIKDPRVNILTGDTTVCIGLPMPLSVEVTPRDSLFTFTWTPTAEFTDGGLTVQPYFFSQTPGTYNYTIRVQSLTDGCYYEDSIKIIVAPPVDIIIHPGNTTIKYGSEIQLDAIRLSPDHLFYTWVPNDGTLDNPNISNPKAKPLDSTTYIVYGMNEWGCRDSAIVTIDVDQDMNEHIPSAFTPNGDGKNDLFRIRGLKYQRIVDFKVFNRWGQLVYDYKTGDPQGWDGTFNGQPVDMGVFNYSVILAKPGQVDKIMKGTVTLIR